MTTILLIIHLMVALTLVALVLLQRSEGGALGMGGSGGGMMSGRGAGNLLTRATGVAGAVFFATSLTLVILASRSSGGGSILDNVAPSPAGIVQPAPVTVPAPLGSGLDEQKPSVPATVAPAAPASAPTAPATPAEPAVPRAQ